MNGSSNVAAVPAQHRNGAADSGEASATSGGTASNGRAAEVAPSVKPQADKAVLGAGLARQLRQKEAELARMREEMYAKQQRLHQEQARAYPSTSSGRASRPNKPLALRSHLLPGSMCDGAGLGCCDIMERTYTRNK
jgi:TolA-binding protein